LFFSSLDTYWLISKPSQTDTLYLKFTSFRIEDSPSCIYDYVKVYSGMYFLCVWGLGGRDRMLVEFTVTCAISAYHH